VTAVDMSAALVEKCMQKLADKGLAGRVQLVVSDARDLREVSEKGFDAVLIMGPLYHLVLEEDRRTALNEAYDTLRAGGVIFTAFISRLGIMGDVMKNIPDWIEGQDHVRSHLERGRHPDDAPRGGFRDTSCGFRRLRLYTRRLGSRR
jgi:cyclopropane fatty-acyl-phospholipid synthase-like methyltransferase